MKRRITVRGLIVKNNKIFGVVHKRHSGDVADYWCTPGGGLEIGESIIDGLQREMLEETGVKPVIGNLVFIQQYIKDKNEEELEFFFHITNPQDYENVDTANTSHGPDEIHQFGFVDPKTVNFLPKILRDVDFSQIINHDGAPEILSYL